MNVSPDQLQFDVDALVRELREHHTASTGAERLLKAMVRTGLAECDLVVAAALCVELDQPTEDRWR
jgi:hypothetical protein